jgi:hypothetical protein
MRKSKSRSKRRITSLITKPRGKSLVILKMLKTKSPQEVYNILKEKNIKEGRKTWTKLSFIRALKKHNM